MNRVKTFLLLAFMTVVLIIAGDILAGQTGLYYALFFAGVMNFFAYWYSDRIAIKMTRSQSVSESEAPQLYKVVRKLCRNANLPYPEIYMTPSQQPNAFAAGRNPSNAVVAVTRGAMNLLNEEELEGVLAHELAHIKNRDTLVSTVAAVMAGALAFLARMALWGNIFGGRRRQSGGNLLRLVLIIFAPLAAMLIRMAISRSREYQADASGAMIARNSRGLASALEKMSRYAKNQPMRVNQAAAHMFILNPLSAEGFNRLFSTHPPAEERIKRLNNLDIR